MTKIDFKKELKNLYNPSVKEVQVVEVPQMNYLMIDGSGDPNTAQEYKDAVETLFGLSYAIKFMIKKGESEIDYGVMPLEGLWWVDNMADFSVDDKNSWKWTMMIMQPEFVTQAIVQKAIESKKDLPALSKVKFEVFNEGLTVQIMHIGPYSAEGSTIQRLHKFVEENGYKLVGKHHEIYLGDPRKSVPEKLKTVIRQPIGK